MKKKEVCAPRTVWWEKEREGEFSRGLAIKSTAGNKERWLNSLQDRLPSIALVPFSHGSWYDGANKTRNQPV